MVTKLEEGPRESFAMAMKSGLVGSLKQTLPTTSVSASCLKPAQQYVNRTPVKALYIAISLALR